MPRYSLRTLIVVMLLGGLLCAEVAPWAVEYYQQRAALERAYQKASSLNPPRGSDGFLPDDDGKVFTTADAATIPVE